jgi:hypothetical protein
MIAEKRTGKNSGPALADYRIKKISKRRNYQIMGVDTVTDTDTEE